MIYIRGLDFEEKPSYEMIRGKFKDILMRLHTNRKEEVPLDWKILRDKKREDKKQQKKSPGNNEPKASPGL
jgi:hypothetical protein